MTDDLITALAALEEAEQAGAQDVLPELALLRARVALTEGRLADVVSVCRAALDQGPRPATQARLAAIGAEAAMDLHDPATAFELATAALVASHEGPPDRPTAAAVATHLGAVYRTVGAFRAAAGSFQRALDLDPSGDHRLTATAGLFDCLSHLATVAPPEERPELQHRAERLLAQLPGDPPAPRDLDALQRRAAAREVRGDLAGAFADEQRRLRLDRQRTRAEADHLVEQIVLRAGLRVGRREAEAAEHELRAAALVDPLTRLLNRRGLDAALAVSTFRGSVLMVDIDHFKRINDRFGHAAGDEVLVRMALLLADVLREGDLLCRYGGEEFLAALPSTDLAEAVLVGDRLRAAAAGHAWERVVEGLDVVTVSVGVAAAKGRGVRPALRHADRALYRAKRAGRNRVAISDAGA